MATYTTNYNLEKPAGNENVDIETLNENMDKVDAALGEKADEEALTNHTQNPDIHVTAAEKQTWNGKGNTNTIIASDVAVPSSAWTADATHEGYPFKAEIAVAGCTAGHVPEVVFGLAEAVDGKLAPVAMTSSGKVTIYSKEALVDITIPTIVLTKVVSV